MNALAVIGIGIIMSVCLYWFYIIFHKDIGFSWLSEEWRLGPRGAYAGIIALIAAGIIIIPILGMSYLIVCLYLSRTIKAPPSMLERNFFGLPQPNAVYNDVIGSLSGVLNWSLIPFWIAISVVLFIIRLYIIKGNSREDIRRRQIFYRPDHFPPRVLPPKRLLIPTASAFILVVGGLVYNIILFVDPHAGVHAINSIPNIGALEIPPSIIKAVNASSNLGRCSVFALALILKSYLGPIITGYVLSTEFYTLISYGNFQPVPIISSILNWVFQGFPVWASTAYLVIQVGYNVFSNGIETITDLGHHH
jgi:hypothetical protein